MKEQIKTPEKELNKMEIGNLSDAEFKTLVIRMLEELREDLNSIKKKIQSEAKDTLIKIKNYLQGNNSRVDEAKNQINDLEHKEAKNNQSEQVEKKNSYKWGQCKQPLGQHQAVQRSHHRGARGEGKEQEIRNLFEKIMKENFPNLVKEIDVQVHETQKVPDKMDAKRPTPRHIIIKMPKVKK